MFEAIATVFGSVISAGMVLMIFILNGVRADQKQTNSAITKMNDLLTKEIALNEGQSERLNAHDHRISALERTKKTR